MRNRWIWISCALVLGGGCFDPDKASGNTDPSSTGSDTSAGTVDTTVATTNDSTATTANTTTADGTDTDTTGPIGPESCGGGAGLCVSTPEGWTGPVVVASAAPGVTPDCAGLEALVTAQADLDAPATCACQCEPAAGAYCENALLSAWGDDATCSVGTVFTQVLHPDNGGDPCNFMPGGENTGEVPVDAASHWTISTQSIGGSCTPTPTIDIPAATYQRSVSGCAAPALDMACEGDASCFEAPGDPFAPGLCVWRAGAHDCPAGDFSVRAVHNRGEVVDGRSCSECTCGEASGSCPTSEAQLFEGYYCNDAPSPVNGDCAEVCVLGNCMTYAISALLTIGPAEATCPPTGGELVGELTEQDPITFCCTP